jgi:hypothetical protein
MAQSYQELRKKFNERDGEIQAARKASETLTRLKEAVSGRKPEGEPQRSAPVAPSGPTETSNAEYKTLYPELVPELEKLDGLSNEVRSLREQLATQESRAREAEEKQIERAQSSVLREIYQEVGERDYGRVFDDPEWSEWIGSHVRAGDDPRYIYDYVNGKLNEARAQNVPSGDATAGNAAAGALAPGGEAGGEKSRPPETDADRIAREMNEYANTLGDGFWAKGKSSGL